ncbi:MAG: ABC transporter ATP-binding protein [Anaerolineae bacterium]|nr:ABC transporter ATP-binding protein [Anaerolineae bacterium]
MQTALRTYGEILARYLRPQWRRALLLSVLLLASIGLQLYNPQVLRRFIDTATAGGEMRTLAWAALVFMGVALANQVLSVAATYVSENVAWITTNALREDLALHCLGLDMPFHKSHTPGEMIERIDGDVTALASFFSQFVIHLLGSALLLVGILVVLWQIDWRVGVVMTGYALVCLGAMLAIRTMVVPYWTAARHAAAEFTGFLVERLSGIEDIRANGAVPYVLRRFYELMRERLHRDRRAVLVSNAMWFVFLTLTTLGMALSFILSSRLYRAGLISLGTAYIVFHYTQMMGRPFNLLSRQMEVLQKAGAGIERATRILRMQPSIRDGAGSKLAPGPLAVEFRGVSFTYDGEDRVLADLSFRLAPGKVLGLLGRTGSGKTTVARLLSRLYDAEVGEVLVGGVDIRAVPLRELRQRVGVVTQDVQLFQASVRDNLTFFDPRISDVRILQVLDELGLSEWYSSLPEGLDTELGADGAGLSAGEAQLLAFARVFLRDPGLVILDEASSRLDLATEQLIERAVDRLLRRRTGVIVAHRVATVQRADEIMIVESGGVCEMGERQSLAADPNSRFSGLLRTGLEEALA